MKAWKAIIVMLLALFLGMVLAGCNKKEDRTELSAINEMLYEHSWRISKLEKEYFAPNAIVVEDEDGHLRFEKCTFTEPNELVVCERPVLRVAHEGDIFCIKCGSIYRQGELIDPNEVKQ